MTPEQPQDSRRAMTSLPLLRMLLLDFPASRIGDLWYEAAAMLPVIDLRMYCRSHIDLLTKISAADRYDVILVDADNRELWFEKLRIPTGQTLFEAAILIAGQQPLPAIQTALLHAGYTDVMCIQEINAKALIHSAIKSFLRNLRANHIELPSAVVAPIQRALIKSV